jgi:hypothetical protein
MPRIDLDDLLDAGEVAALIGLNGNPRAVSVYRSRYDDFPDPVVVKNSGKCTLWRRQDVEGWARRRRDNAQRA